MQHTMLSSETLHTWSPWKPITTAHNRPLVSLKALNNSLFLTMATLELKRPFGGEVKYLHDLPTTSQAASALGLCRHRWPGWMKISTFFKNCDSSGDAWTRCCSQVWICTGARCLWSSTCVLSKPLPVRIRFEKEDLTRCLCLSRLQTQNSLRLPTCVGINRADKKFILAASPEIIMSTTAHFSCMTTFTEKWINNTSIWGNNY